MARARFAELPEEARRNPLRACLTCKLIKNQSQWLDSGCDNCGEHDDFTTATTKQFTGYLAMMDVRDSWLARWQKQQQLKPGIYALKVKAVREEEIHTEEAQESESAF